MKKLFTNYNFTPDKNDRRLLTSFCKQVIKQLEGEEKYYLEVRAFNSILDKLSGNSETIKLTKDERTRLVNQLAENVKYLQNKIEKSWIFKKWLYRSLHSQYENVLEKHFKG